MTTTTLKYGTYTHGTPQRTRDGGYYRLDEYKSHKNGETTVDRMFCEGPNDDSPVHDGAYSAQCSLCWLNFPHTEAAHEQRTS